MLKITWRHLLNYFGSSLPNREDPGCLRIAIQSAWTSSLEWHSNIFNMKFIIKNHFLTQIWLYLKHFTFYRIFSVALQEIQDKSTNVIVGKRYRDIKPPKTNIVFPNFSQLEQLKKKTKLFIGFVSDLDQGKVFCLFFKCSNWENFIEKFGENKMVWRHEQDII